MKKIKQHLFIFAFCALPFLGSAQNWLPVGTGFTWASGVKDFYVDTTDDLLYIAGTIGYAGSVCSPGIFAWNGTNYLPLGCGIDWNCQGTYQGPGASVTRVTKYNNEIYVAGDFTSAGGKVCNNIARWNGVTWDSLGIGVDHSVSGMRVINGELYVAGAFTNAGGIPVNGLAKWNGTTWSDVHNLPSYGGNLLTDVIEYNGELYVCGNFSGSGGCREIVKWDGTNWVNVGGGLYGSLSFLERMCIYQNKLYVAGYFIKSQNVNNPGNFIAAWDGTNWSDPGGGTFDITSPNNNGQIHDMHVYHNELYIASTFKYAGGAAGSGIAKWDGTQWCTFDTIGSFDNRPYAITDYHDTLFVGGSFWSISGDSLYRITKWGGGNYVDTCGYFYLGVNDPLSPLFSVSVYPNPTTETATFQFTGLTGKAIIRLYDAIGREVWSEDVNGSQVIFSAVGQSAGMYFYRVEQEGAIKATGKLIIQ